MRLSSKGRHPPAFLRLLRVLTLWGWSIHKRGIGRLCDWIRWIFAGRSRVYWVDDFDGDLQIRVDISGDIGSRIFWFGTHSGGSLAVLGRLFGPADIFMDIGANIGEFTLFAAKRLPKGRVYSFEPVGRIFEFLRGNVEKNGLRNVRLVRAALSDKEGEAEIFIPEASWRGGSGNEGLASLCGGDTLCRVERVPLIMLNAFARRKGLRRLDLVKIDVEGSEMSVLRGGKATLQKFRPKILIEISETMSHRAGYKAREILLFLQALGYRFQTVNYKGDLGSLEVSRLSGFENVLCLPG